jgi:hypothetical protein
MVMRNAPCLGWVPSGLGEICLKSGTTPSISRRYRTDSDSYPMMGRIPNDHFGDAFGGAAKLTGLTALSVR